MIKQLLLAGAAIGLMSSTALAAEYYIVQEKGTKKCKVVDARRAKRPGCRSGRWPSRRAMSRQAAGRRVQREALSDQQNSLKQWPSCARPLPHCP
jgi:hypothetical protein